MRLEQYNPTSGLEDILKNHGITFPDRSDLYIFPDIPVIRQTEDKHAPDCIWSDSLFTFAKLSSFANVSSGNMSNHISKLGRLMLMEEVLDELENEVKLLGGYRRVRGFTDSLLTMLAEVKHMTMSPEGLKNISDQVAGQDLAEKLEDLSLVFRLYQKKMTERMLADDIDLLHNLSESINDGSLDYLFPGRRRAIVFGFYDFTRAQVNVIESLGRKLDDLLIFVPQYRDLKKLGDTVTGMLGIRETSSVQMQYPEGGGKREIVINSCPAVNFEFDLAFREIKRLITEEKYDFCDIAIIFRSLDAYSTRVINTAGKYGIPVRIDDSLSIRTSLYGRFLDDIVSLAASNCRRDEFLGLLKNPVTMHYLHDNSYTDDIAVIEEMSAKRFRTFQGFGSWKRFFENIGNDSVYRISKNTNQKITALLDILSSGFGNYRLSSLTESVCYILDYINISEINNRLAGKDMMTDNCWNAFSSFIRELRFVSDTFDRKFFDVSEYRSFLNDLMKEKTYSFITDSDTSHVQILDGLKVRGISCPVVFIMNVDEGSFPSPYKKDPVVKIHERRQINLAVGEEIFAEDEVHYEKEEQLFRLMCGSAEEKLFLSYSRMDDDYQEKNISQLTDTLNNAIFREYGFDDLYSADSHYCLSDMLSSYFYLNFPNEGEDENISLDGNLKKIAGSSISDFTIGGINAELSRYRTSGRYSEYEGIVDPDYVQKAGYFSPTELEEYGTCPFRYFSARKLKIGEELLVEDKIDPMELGNLFHDMLYELFQNRLSEYFTYEKIHSLSPELAVKKYRELLKDKDYNIYFSHLTDDIREIERKRVLEYLLPSFIEGEINRIKEQGYIPFMFEERVEFDVNGRKLKGKIDRADRDSACNVTVYDYKSGSIASKKYFDYRNLQLPLYLIAVEQKGYKPFGGYYLSVRTGDKTGKEGAGKLSLDEVKSVVSRYTGWLEQGYFPPVPGDKEDDFTEVSLAPEYDFSNYGICSFCGFSDICRVKNGVLRRICGNE